MYICIYDKSADIYIYVSVVRILDFRLDTIFWKILIFDTIFETSNRVSFVDREITLKSWGSFVVNGGVGRWGGSRWSPRCDLHLLLAWYIDISIRHQYMSYRYIDISILRKSHIVPFLLLISIFYRYINIFDNTNMYVYICIYIYLHVYMCMYIRNIYIHMCSLCSAYICICICICKCFYTLKKLFRSSKNQSTGSPPVTQLHSSHTASPPGCL